MPNLGVVELTIAMHYVFDFRTTACCLMSGTSATRTSC